MDDEVVGSESQPALDLLAERGDRLLAHAGVGGGEVDEVVGVDDYGRNPGLRADAFEGLDLFVFERTSLPPARVAREDLHRVRAERLSLEQRIVQAARDAGVETDARSRRPLSDVPPFGSARLFAGARLRRATLRAARVFHLLRRTLHCP